MPALEPEARLPIACRGEKKEVFQSDQRKAALADRPHVFFFPQPFARGCLQIASFVRWRRQAAPFTPVEDRQSPLPSQKGPLSLPSAQNTLFGDSPYGELGQGMVLAFSSVFPGSGILPLGKTPTLCYLAQSRRFTALSNFLRRLSHFQPTRITEDYHGSTCRRPQKP